MTFEVRRPVSSHPADSDPPTLATSPRLPECPRHGYDRPEAECYDDAGCPEFDTCRDCEGSGLDRDFPTFACAACDGRGEPEVPKAIR